MTLLRAAPSVHNAHVVGATSSASSLLVETEQELLKRLALLNCFGQVDPSHGWNWRSEPRPRDPTLIVKVFEMVFKRDRARLPERSLAFGHFEARLGVVRADVKQ